MTADNPFRPDLAGTARKHFVGVQGMSLPANETLEFRIFKLENRAEKLRDAQTRHHQKHRGQFIDAEYKKLQRLNPLNPGWSRSAGPRPPGGHQSQRTSHQHAWRQLAEANVDCRHERRLYTISAIERLQKRKLQQGQGQAQTHQRKRRR